MWGLVWDERNVRTVATYGVTRPEVDSMFDLGDWLAQPFPTDPERERLIGATAPLHTGGRIITVVVEAVQTAHGTRWRPFTARVARRKEQERWHARFSSPTGPRGRYEAP